MECGEFSPLSAGDLSPSESEVVPEPPVEVAAVIVVEHDPAPLGAVIVVEHEGTKHEAVVRGFAMGCHATLRDGADTPVFVASGAWRRKS